MTDKIEDLINQNRLIEANERIEEEDNDQIQPTLEHLTDPYVLQLIRAISGFMDDIEELEDDISERALAEHYGPFGTVCINTGQFDAGECWLCHAKKHKKAAADMQLAAGRYQYMHEHAQRAINKIDDLFEYAYSEYSLPALQRVVRGHLATYTEAVAKVATAVPTQPDSIVETAKERIADPDIVDVDLEDL